MKPIAITLAITAAVQCNALIFMSSGATSFNTTAPAGPLANSGWELQGKWGQFLGTPVSSNWFIAAKHVGGKVGDTFALYSIGYKTVRRVDHPTADLTLWRVARPFPRHAALYTLPNETGKHLVVFGRSAPRGTAANVTNGAVVTFKGWQWGTAGAGITRWGTNVVQSVAQGGGSHYLVMTFDRSGGLHEATLATGDSSGGVFIKDGAAWKLAGINYAVQADFARAQSGASFNGALFDAGGFWSVVGGARMWNPDVAQDVPTQWIATRVSSFSAWIRATTETQP